MTMVSAVAERDNALKLSLEGGDTVVDNMGCGVVVVGQRGVGIPAQRVVLTKADLEAMLAWLA